MREKGRGQIFQELDFRYGSSKYPAHEVRRALRGRQQAGRQDLVILAQLEQSSVPPAQVSSYRAGVEARELAEAVGDVIRSHGDFASKSVRARLEIPRRYREDTPDVQMRIALPAADDPSPIPTGILEKLQVDGETFYLHPGGGRQLRHLRVHGPEHRDEGDLVGPDQQYILSDKLWYAGNMMKHVRANSELPGRL